MLRILFPFFILIFIQSNAFAEEALPPPLPTIEKDQKKPKSVPKPAPEKQDKAPQDPPTPQAKIDAATYQKVMSEYRDYLSGVPAKVRDEIREYRKEIIRLNKEKTSAYKQLSIEAQKFLKKEREFKKRLPIRQRKKVTQASNSK